MTASGEIMYCSRSQNKEIFLAALCSLGAVGIILTVTWQCEQAFRLLQLSEPKPLEEVWFKLARTEYSKRKTLYINRYNFLKMKSFSIICSYFKLPGNDLYLLKHGMGIMFLPFCFALAIPEHSLNASSLSCALNRQQTEICFPLTCCTGIISSWLELNQ